jgi:phosphonatase-like hydrolase
MHDIKLAVFDMAGTVVNENNIVYKTLQKAINKKGYDFSLDIVLEHGAGKEKHQAIKDILSQADGSETVASETIFDDFEQMLDEAYETLEVNSFEGVEQLVSDLKSRDLKIALNTGYNTRIAKLLLQKMDWRQDEHYDALITADDVTKGRPDPAMIHKAMEVLGVGDASKVLKAGDSIIDIEEGKNAKCGVTIGVTTGAHSREQLQSADPTYVLDSLKELRNLLDSTRTSL